SFFRSHASVASRIAASACSVGCISFHIAIRSSRRAGMSFVVARLTVMVDAQHRLYAPRMQSFLGVELPIVQAPMAGSQKSALAMAVASAGGLGSLPCALLSHDDIRAEIAAIRAATDRPFVLNFFCHTPPPPDEAREKAWREALAPYYAELGI